MKLLTQNVKDRNMFAKIHSTKKKYIRHKIVNMPTTFHVMYIVFKGVLSLCSVNRETTYVTRVIYL